MSVPITLCLANHGRKKTQKIMRDDAERNHDRFPNAFMLWQEIDEADPWREHYFLGDIYGEDHRFAKFGSAVPIGIPDEFRMFWATMEKASPGLAGWSPHRVLVGAKVEPRGQTNIDPFFVYNTHVMRARRGVADSYRKLHYELLEETLHGHKRKGETAFLGGDFNNANPPIDGVRILLGAGIDHLYMVEGSVEFEIEDKGSVPMHTDGHDLRFIKGELKAA